MSVRDLHGQPCPEYNYQCISGHGRSTISFPGPLVWQTSQLQNRQHAAMQQCTGRSTWLTPQDASTIRVSDQIATAAAQSQGPGLQQQQQQLIGPQQLIWPRHVSMPRHCAPLEGQHAISAQQLSSEQQYILTWRDEQLQQQQKQPSSILSSRMAAGPTNGEVTSIRTTLPHGGHINHMPHGAAAPTNAPPMSAGNSSLRPLAGSLNMNDFCQFLWELPAVLKIVNKVLKRQDLGPSDELWDTLTAALASSIYYRPRDMRAKKQATAREIAVYYLCCSAQHAEDVCFQASKLRDTRLCCMFGTMGIEYKEIAKHSRCSNKCPCGVGYCMKWKSDDKSADDRTADSTPAETGGPEQEPPAESAAHSSSRLSCATVTAGTAENAQQESRTAVLAPRPQSQLSMHGGRSSLVSAGNESSFIRQASQSAVPMDIDEINAAVRSAVAPANAAPIANQLQSFTNAQAGIAAHQAGQFEATAVDYIQQRQDCSAASDEELLEDLDSPRPVGFRPVPGAHQDLGLPSAGLGDDADTADAEDDDQQLSDAEHCLVPDHLHREVTPALIEQRYPASGPGLAADCCPAGNDTVIKQEDMTGESEQDASPEQHVTCR